MSDDDLPERSAYRVRLAADEGEFPVWWPDDVRADDRPPLSNTLSRQLEAWADESDTALSGNTLHMSGVRTRLCHAERELASALAAELGPSWEVVFFDALLGRDVTTRK